MTNPTQLKPIPAQEVVPPGHPLVVAHSIVLAFPSYATATRPDEDGHATAQGDERITGGATMVAEALNVLRLAKTDSGFQEAVEYARDRWYRLSGAEPAALAAGQQQAERVSPLLRQALREWAW